MKKNLLLIILFTLITLQYGFSQNTDFLKIIDDQTKRITALEDKLKLIETFYGDQKDIIEEKYNNSIKQLNLDFKEKKQNDNPWIVARAALGLLSLGGVITIILNAKKYVETELNKKFDSIISTNRKKIIEIIDAAKFEEKIKNDKKITVLLDKDHQYKDELSRFLEKYGFKHFNFYTITDNLKGIKSDLIIINNFRKGMNGDELNKLFKEDRFKQPILHFINGFAKLDEEYIPEIFNHTNNLTTVYPRMVELLMFAENMK